MSNYSKNATKHKADAAGNVCYCSHRVNSSDGHNKLYQQEQMGVVMGFKQGVQCVCVCVCVPVFVPATERLGMLEIICVLLYVCRDVCKCSV